MDFFFFLDSVKSNAHKNIHVKIEPNENYRTRVYKYMGIVHEISFTH